MKDFFEVLSWIKPERAMLIISALLFLYKSYRAVETYFTQKALADAEREKQLKEVMAEVEKYPQYRAQSKEIQAEYNKNFEEIKKCIAELRDSDDKRKRNELRDRLLQQYRYYTSPVHNPMKMWSEMESDAFWQSFGDYEDKGGNGHMHNIVQPQMRALEVIPMHEEENIKKLMNSRR